VVQLCQVVDKSPSPVALLPRKAIADRWRRMVDVDVDGGDQESAVVQHMAAMTTHVNSFLKSLEWQRGISFEFPLLGCTSSNKLALTGGKECSRDKGPPPQAKSLGIVHLVALDTRHHVARSPPPPIIRGTFGPDGGTDGLTDCLTAETSI